MWCMCGLVYILYRPGSSLSPSSLKCAPLPPHSHLHPPTHTHQHPHTHTHTHTHSHQHPHTHAHTHLQLEERYAQKLVQVHQSKPILHGGLCIPHWCCTFWSVSEAEKEDERRKGGGRRGGRMGGFTPDASFIFFLSLCKIPPPSPRFTSILQTRFTSQGVQYGCSTPLWTQPGVPPYH